MLALNGYYDGNNVIIDGEDKPKLSSKVKIVFLDVKTEEHSWPDESAPQKIRLGLAKGKINVPADIDAHNDEIAEMFGV